MARLLTDNIIDDWHSLDPGPPPDVVPLGFRWSGAPLSA
jgi:hypothetical protein